MTQTQSVQRAMKHLEGLRADLKIRLELYDKRIKEAEGMNLREEHINRIRAERDNLEKLYQASIERAKTAVQQAQEAENAEAAQAEERRKAAEEQVKARIRIKWVQAGCDLNKFEDAWPDMYSGLVVEKPLAAMGAEDKPKPTINL